MKHTPGPWFNEINISPRYSTTTGERIDDHKGGWINAGPYKSICNLMPIDEMEANANLMAAAPCMLEIMERALRLSKEHPDFCLHAMEQFERVIKKAKGELKEFPTEHAPPE